MKAFRAALGTGAVLFFAAAITLSAQHEGEKQGGKPEARQDQAPAQPQRAQPQPQQQRAQQQPPQQRAQQQPPQERAQQQQPRRAQQAPQRQKAQQPQRAQQQPRQEKAQQQQPQRAQQQQPQRAQQAPQPQKAQQAQRAQQQQPQQQARAQAPPQRSEAQAKSWQQQRGWQHGGGWQAQSSFQGDRAHNWASDHRTWAQRGGYGGYFVPQASFNLDFGSEHFFRLRTLPVMYMGYPRFAFDGFSFIMVDPWPESWASNWYASDDVYIVYNDGYYMYDRRYPRTGIAISLVL